MKQILMSWAVLTAAVSLADVVIPLKRENAPDPFTVYDRASGYYYHLHTDNPTDGSGGFTADRVVLHRSREAGRLLDSDESRVVYRVNAADGVFGFLWAPEMHRAPNGKWYVYTSCTRRKEGGDKRLLVLEAKTDDPFDGFVFKSCPDESVFAIDPTVFTAADGRQYMCYSQVKEGKGQVLQIREMTSPWTLGSRQAELAVAELPWELVPPYDRTKILEGAFFVTSRKTGAVSIVYSANGCWTQGYCLGVLDHLGGDLCDAKNWKRRPQPIFKSGNGVYGPGHAAFFRSPDEKELWVSYHFLSHPNDSCAPTDRLFGLQKFNVDETTGLPAATEPVRPGERSAAPSGEGVRESAPSLPSLDLNGSWSFRFVENGSIESAADPDFEPTETMTVPACYDMMPRYLCKRGTGLYRRTFVLDRPVDNAWLVVDGMGLRGDFRIDGRSLGVRPYPYARLELATGPLAAGEHTLFAALDNRFDWETMKLARPYYDFYCHGGFYHGVRLAFDNRKLRVRTRDYRAGEVEIEKAGGESRWREGGVETLVFDGTNEVKAVFRNGRATVRVPGFRLWSPEDPNLHTVSLGLRPSTFGLAPQARFGIRTVEVRDGRLWLNGRPLYLKGANRHESHPTFGAATPESLMLTDIQNLKALGGNFFRGAHYQQAQRFLDLCDENGVLVWEESLGWGNSPEEMSDPEYARQQVEQTREMVRASFNHPSVVIFAFQNENASESKEGVALNRRLVEAIRAEDSGRLVTFACNRTLSDESNAFTDLISFNTYPGWIGTEPGSPEHLRGAISNNVAEIVAYFRKRWPEKPIIVSEMGTCGEYGRRDPAAAQWTEDFQSEYVGDVIDEVFARPEIGGLAIWQFTDARSFHRDGCVVRVKPFAENLAGLFDGYRRPKAVVRVVREKFSERITAR